MLATCGMAVRLVDVRYDEVHVGAMVTSPAEPARGHVRISDEGTIRWELVRQPRQRRRRRRRACSPRHRPGHRHRASRVQDRRVSRSRRHRTLPGGGAATGGMVTISTLRNRVRRQSVSDCRPALGSFRGCWVAASSRSTPSLAADHYRCGQRFVRSGGAGLAFALVRLFPVRAVTRRVLAGVVAGRMRAATSSADWRASWGSTDV